jgi:hypothetical protein
MLKSTLRLPVNVLTCVHHTRRNASIAAGNRGKSRGLLSVTKSIAKARCIPRSERKVKLPDDKGQVFSISVLHLIAMNTWSLGPDEYELVRQNGQNGKWERITSDCDVSSDSHIKIAGKFFCDNIIQQRDRREQVEEREITMISFFTFAAVSDVQMLRAQMLELFSRMGVLGTVYLSSEEGVNAQLAVPTRLMRGGSFEQSVQALHPVLSSIKLNIDEELRLVDELSSEPIPFDKLVVKRKRQILADGLTRSERGVDAGGDTAACSFATGADKNDKESMDDDDGYDGYDVEDVKDEAVDEDDEFSRPAGGGSDATGTGATLDLVLDWQDHGRALTPVEWHR